MNVENLQNYLRANHEWVSAKKDHPSLYYFDLAA